MPSLWVRLKEGLAPLVALFKGAKVLPDSSEIKWAPVPPMSYPARIKKEHYNVQCRLEGIFEFEPDIGTSLPVGEHILTVTFLPADEEMEVLRKALKVTVDKATPQLTWKAPHPINDGTPLSRKQLAAGCVNLPSGEYIYNPPPKSKLPIGQHTLSVEYIPEEEFRNNYKSAFISVPITVNPMIQPVIEWNPKGEIYYEERLSKSNILTATCPGFDGAIHYDPPEDALLQAGDGQNVRAIFTPLNRNEFRMAHYDMTLDVKRAIPRIDWPTPNFIYEGTALNSNHLNASNDLIPSTTAVYKYKPGIGCYDLPPGQHTLTLEFTPDHNLLKNYAPHVYTNTITVRAKKIPVIMWCDEEFLPSIHYGQELSRSNIYNAICRSYLEDGEEKRDDGAFGGTFSYDPPYGSILDTTAEETDDDEKAYDDLYMHYTRQQDLEEGPHSDFNKVGQLADLRAEDMMLAKNKNNALFVDSTLFPYNKHAKVHPLKREKVEYHTITLTFTPNSTTEYETIVITKKLRVVRCPVGIVWEYEDVEELLKNEALNEKQLTATIGKYTSTRI
jgi:hypothetical protein